jgi:hypothetical protein
MVSHRAHGGRDPAVHGPARPSALRPDQTLHAPTQDSDGTRATRRHVTPRCAAWPGSCTNRLGDRDGGSPTTARHDRDMVSHRAHGGRDPAVHGPAHPSALCPDQTLPAPTQDSDGTEATRRHVTPRSAARPGSCTYRLGDPDGGPSTNAWYDYDMAPYRIQCGRDPAAPPGPSRGTPPRPEPSCPTENSGGIPVTRPCATPRRTARTGFTRTDSDLVDLPNLRIRAAPGSGHPTTPSLPQRTSTFTPTPHRRFVFDNHLADLHAGPHAAFGPASSQLLGHEQTLVSDTNSTFRSQPPFF